MPPCLIRRMVVSRQRLASSSRTNRVSLLEYAALTNDSYVTSPHRQPALLAASTAL